MIVTLTKPTYIRQNSVGVPHQRGEKVEVPDTEGRDLIINKRAVEGSVKLEDLK